MTPLPAEDPPPPRLAIAPAARATMPPAALPGALPAALPGALPAALPGALPADRVADAPPPEQRWRLPTDPPPA